MQQSSLQIIHLLYTYSYFILFPLVVIEGPVVTMIAGFLISVGAMAFIPAYLTIIFADLTGDILFYSAGRYFLNSRLNKIVSFLGVDINKIKKAEKVMIKNRAKILFFGKLSHAVGGPILIAAGALKISIKDFLWYNFWATLPKSLVFLMIGYFFSSALDRLNKYLGLTTLGLAAVTALVIVFYWFVYSKARKAVSNL